LSVHRLRIKNLITVEEVSAVENKKSIEKPQTTKPVISEDTNKKVAKEILIKKKSNKKEENFDTAVN
jgi:hypothetical protein